MPFGKRLRALSQSTPKVPPTVATLGVALSTIGHAPDNSIQKEAEAKPRRPSTNSSRPHPLVYSTPRSSTTNLQPSVFSPESSVCLNTVNGLLSPQYRPSTVNTESECPSLSTSTTSTSTTSSFTTSSLAQNSSTCTVFLSEHYCSTPPHQSPPPPPSSFGSNRIPRRKPVPPSPKSTPALTTPPLHLLTSSNKVPGRSTNRIQNQHQSDRVPSPLSLLSSPTHKDPNCKSRWSIDSTHPNHSSGIRRFLTYPLNSSTKTPTTSKSAPIPPIFPMLPPRSPRNSKKKVCNQANSIANASVMGSTLSLTTVTSSVSVTGMIVVPSDKVGIWEEEGVVVEDEMVGEMERGEEVDWTWIMGDGTVEAVWEIFGTAGGRPNEWELPREEWFQGEEEKKLVWTGNWI